MNRLIVICIGLSFICDSVRGQDIVLKKGVVIDSLAVSDTQGESFALYLPNSYQPEALSPIVFIFDPGGRGKSGVSPFVSAAEKYGHILVCSNNSRNGPQKENFEIANRLTNHIFNNFNIADDQLYIAGFSGGSRLATTIAVLTNTFAGVIACGAGFSSSIAQIPSDQNFAYAAIIGDSDFNYRELHRNKTYLNKIGFENTLFTFKGEHRWPPKEEILNAFNWLNLKYVKKKGNPNTNLLLSQLKTELQTTKNLEKEKRYLPAAENYSRILDTYASFFELDSVANLYAALRKKSAYVSALKSAQKSLEQEKSISERLYDKLFADLKNPEKAKIKSWEKEVGKLNTLANKGNTVTQLMVGRVKKGLLAACYERVYFSGGKNSSEKELAQSIRKLLFPKP